MTTMVEPEWDQDTRDLVLALDAIVTCGVCGRPAAICQDPERQFDWETPPATRCHAHTAVLDARKQMSEETNPHMGALLFGARLRETTTGGNL